MLLSNTALVPLPYKPLLILFPGHFGWVHLVPPHPKFSSLSNATAWKVQQAGMQVCVVINHARRAGNTLHLLLSSNFELMRL